MIENICIWIMLICAALESLHLIIEGVLKLIIAAREYWAPKKEPQAEVS